MKAKIVLCDDDGNVLPDSSTAYYFELGGQNLNEIEQAIELFCHQALSGLEANILQSAQQQHKENFKNRTNESVRNG